MFNILLVDNINIRNELLKLRIESCGFEFNYITAKNGLECLNILKNNKVDLIIMEHIMDGLNGINTLKEIRKANKSIPIYVSSMCCCDCEESCKQYGIAGIIPRPVSSKLLIKSIMQSLYPINFKEMAS